MSKSSYIFNFNKIPYALIVTIVVILCVEYIGYNKFDGKFASHEVDKLLSDIELKEYNADYVFIGDSVGLQLSRQYSGDPIFAVMATNQAVEMTGQYFIVKRYLAKNTQPKAVLFASRPFIEWNDLNQVYTENFVLRTFNHVGEIYDVFLAKFDLTYLAKMITYKILFSYKYRLQLQNQIIGFTNADIYSGVDSQIPPAKYHDFSFLKIFKRTKEKYKEKSSVSHFGKLVNYLKNRDIDFYYLPVPIEKQQQGSFLTKQYNDLFNSFLPEMEKKYINIHFFNSYPEYPKHMFRDHTHYNEIGLEPAEKYMNIKVDSITSKYN